eukprot:11200254-Lingulodinium_polyedra.AAC.1
MARRRFAGRFPPRRQMRAITLATSMLRGGVCGPAPPNIRVGACQSLTSLNQTSSFTNRLHSGSSGLMGSK